MVFQQCEKAYVFLKASGGLEGISCREHLRPQTTMIFHKWCKKIPVISPHEYRKTSNSLNPSLKSPEPSFLDMSNFFSCTNPMLGPNNLFSVPWTYFVHFALHPGGFQTLICIQITRGSCESACLSALISAHSWSWELYELHHF